MSGIGISQRAQRWLRDKTTQINYLLVIYLIVFFVIPLMLALLNRHEPVLPKDAARFRVEETARLWAAFGETVLLWGALVFGMFAAGCRGFMNNEFVGRAARAVDSVGLLNTVFGEGQTACWGGLFIGSLYFLITLYVLSYIYVFSLIEPPTGFSYWAPRAATAIAIFSMAYVIAQYAAYIRLLAILETLSSHPTAFGADKEHAESLLDGAFRLGTLYEPPGNIFVTIGIVGTFLGLAMGLATLPLPDMLKDRGTDKLVQDALPFVRSMGLALGVSTIGAIAAIFAHLLRGWGGPVVETDALIARVRYRIATL